MEAVTRKLDYVLTADTPDLRTAAAQVKSLRQEAERDRAALVERVAYTWFNRFAALRFMDAHGWHPFRARVLTPANPDESQPELLKLTRTGALPAELEPHTNSQRLNDLLDGRLPTSIAGADPQGEVYRDLVLAACRFYHVLLPNLFEKLDDETELLLPDDLLTATSVAEGFRTEITDGDCTEDGRANVEILGWLYQFYISEKKDTVMARKSAVPTEDIPAVTQLFTPHWIVRYLVENSLGRLWLNSRPNSRLREHMPYYVEDAVQIEDSGADPPAWEPEWCSSGVTHKEGDYQTLMWLRPNPALQGKYHDALGYALTIDGYAYGSDRWGTEGIDGAGPAKVEEIESKGYEKTSFKDLRYCLFLLQRSIKWLGGSGPTDDLKSRFFTCYAAVCKAWKREWRQHKQDLPDLRSYGIRTSETIPTDNLTVATPEEIKLLDPACGSGHMLTYAFDLLYLIYLEEGYAPTEIPALILRHNLHGLEICPRAAQLAELALVFKAREKSRRFFQPEHIVRPNIIELKEIRFEEGELADYFKALGIDPSSFIIQPSSLQKLLHQFEEAKNFGSLIQPCLSEAEIQSARSAIHNSYFILHNSDLLVGATHLKVLRVLEQAEALTQRYHVVVANPPYMGSKGMNGVLKQFLLDNFSDYKYDLFSAFIVRSLSLSLSNGFLGFMSPFVWMFISSYEELRKRLISQATITTLVQLEYSGFDGATVPICTFALQNKRKIDYQGGYVRLSAFRGSENQGPRTLEAIANPNCGWFYRASASNFIKIPGSPIAYWASSRLIEIFGSSYNIESISKPKQGATTSDNQRFLRFWPEVTFQQIGRHLSSTKEAAASGKTWFPYNKGGDFRKWYGNQDFVINYKDDGAEIKAFHEELNKTKPGGRLKNQNLYFKQSISWSKISSASFALRYFPAGFIFDVAGSAIFPAKQEEIALIGSVLNSRVSQAILSVLSPTLNFEAEHLCMFPLVPLDESKAVVITSEFDHMVRIARADWDNFETSWDFRDQPLLRNYEVRIMNYEGEEKSADSDFMLHHSSFIIKGATLQESWNNWKRYCDSAIHRMQELETENNRLFIAAYGLEGELQPAVPEEQITLARADARRDMAAFLSYAVGVMFGRYSLVAPGLVLADAGSTVEDYHRIVRTKYELGSMNNEGKKAATADPDFIIHTSSFILPDEDGIIPVLDGEWFEDDIVARTRDFLRATFGAAHLDANVTWLEKALDKDLRKYFVRDFYKDHLQTYKKRPIYWLVSSPGGSFQALIYLHRYTKDTVNTLLNNYLREFIHKLDARQKHLVHVEATSTNAREKTAARKEADKLRKSLKECQDWEREVVLPLAQQRIELDLDDGVKVNYLKFPGFLAKIPGLEKKEDE